MKDKFAKFMKKHYQKIIMSIVGVIALYTMYGILFILSLIVFICLCAIIYLRINEGWL